MHGENIHLPVCVCVCVSVTLSVNSPTGQTPQRIFTVCDVYVGGKVRVLEFMIFLTLQHNGSK